ncbi:MAG: tRNA (adenosine(37)-N6)-threonylcarbamoyltransferase complex ATPase subunit type 1 TsaE [Patescibacteria group bacterium]
MLSKNIKKTAEVSKVFLNRILKDTKQKGALVVALSGDLGAGKTAFTQTFGKHLGIKNKMSSPTFVLIKKYPIKLKDYKYFFHLDAYRLKNEKELLHLGWDEIIKDKEHIVFIEWPENVAKAIPRGAKRVKVTTNKEGHRKFKY